MKRKENITVEYISRRVLEHVNGHVCTMCI